MFPSRFRYEAPRSVQEAVALLHEGEGEAKVLAGGMSLVPLLKLRFAAPSLLVDINTIAELAYLRREADGTLRIGALTRHGEIERSPLPGMAHPVLAACAPLVADPIVRNRGTLVGSLCHADPQGDWAAAVIALGGHVVAQGPSGRRTIAIEDFQLGPFQNALSYDEVAVEAVVPPPSGTPRGGFLKLERRVGDFATAGTAIAVELSGDVVTRAGIALTGVGSATVVPKQAAAALVGQPLGTGTIERAAALAAEAAQPKSDHRGSAEYKRHVVATFVQRILTRIADDPNGAGRTDHAGRAA